MEQIDPTDISYFGRVYLRSKENNFWDLLDSAYFSKLDLRIYSEDRTKLHPKFFNLTGKSYRLGFRIKNPDLLQGTEMEYSGKFVVPIKLGENPSPDLEHIPEAFDVEMKLCQDFKLVPNSEAEKVIKDTFISSFWIFGTPGKPILEQRFLLQTAPMQYLDDANEGFEKEFISKEIDADKFNISYRTCSTIVSTMMSSSKSGGAMEALQTLYNDTTSDLNISMSEAMELLGMAKRMQRAATAIKDCATETAKNHGISVEPFLKILNTALLAACVDVCGEWKNKNHEDMIPAILGIRADSSLGHMMAECVVLQHGIELSENIRANPLFQVYVTLFKKSFQNVNDVMSYAKESDVKGNNCNQNEVYLLHKLKGWPLEKALDKVLEDGNLAIEQMLKVEILLLEMYPDSEDDVRHKEHENLKRYFHTLKEMYTGGLQFYAFVNRYHAGMIYDCYIDEE